jgi:hypothetical protein
MEIPTPSAFRRPSAFQAEPAPWPVHPPSEEGGRLERQGVTPASVSNGARRGLSGSPSIERRAGTSEPPGTRRPERP